MAESQITAAHLRSTVVDQTSSSVKQGLVISSNPQEGNNVKANTLVTLVASKGTAPVAVPNVVGQQESAAESALQNAGFKPLVKNDPTSSAPIGQVTAQSPSGGTAAPGSTVTITVSGGAVSVPSVVGDSQATATQVLTQAGFQVSVQPGSGPSQYANGQVFNQQPSGRHRGEGLHGRHLRAERRVCDRVSVRPGLPDRDGRDSADARPRPSAEACSPRRKTRIAPTTAQSGYA